MYISIKKFSKFIIYLTLTRIIFLFTYITLFFLFPPALYHWCHYCSCQRHKAPSDSHKFGFSIHVLHAMNIFTHYPWRLVPNGCQWQNAHGMLSSPPIVGQEAGTFNPKTPCGAGNDNHDKRVRSQRQIQMITQHKQNKTAMDDSKQDTN